MCVCVFFFVFFLSFFAFFCLFFFFCRLLPLLTISPLCCRGLQQDVSRLYRELQGVLADPICVKYLEEYIGDNRDQRHLVRFWRAAQKFATLPEDTLGSHVATNIQALYVCI